MQKQSDNVIPMEVFQVTLKGFVTKGKQLLIVRPRAYKRLWDFPGGRIHRGEVYTTLEDTLRRELREELGTKLRIKIGSPWIAYKVPFPKLKKLFPHVKEKRYHGGIITIGYHCEYQSGNIRLENEHVEYRWVDKSDYQKFQFSQWHGNAIKKFFEKFG